jgi:hypothetical protein
MRSMVEGPERRASGTVPLAHPMKMSDSLAIFVGS